MKVEINVHSLYKDKAKLKNINAYIDKALKLAGEGNDVVLYGQGPIWLYLKLGHALHGKVKSLSYRSPLTGEIVIFDHDPF
jgi:hypothetical protein